MWKNSRRWNTVRLPRIQKKQSPGWINTGGASRISSTVPGTCRQRMDTLILSIPPTARSWQQLRRDRAQTWMLPSTRRARRLRNGRRLRPMVGRVTCTRLRDRFKNIRDYSPFSKQWTTESRSVKAATSTSRSWRGISTTMRDGRNCSTRNFPSTWHAESWDKSFRGIFRCSCWRGKSLPRSRRETRSC